MLAAARCVAAAYSAMPARPSPVPRPKNAGAESPGERMPAGGASGRAGGGGAAEAGGSGDASGGAGAWAAADGDPGLGRAADDDLRGGRFSVSDNPGSRPGKPPDRRVCAVRGTWLRIGTGQLPGFGSFLTS